MTTAVFIKLNRSYLNRRKQRERRKFVRTFPAVHACSSKYSIQTHSSEYFDSMTLFSPLPPVQNLSRSKSIVEPPTALGEFGQHHGWFETFAERRVLLKLFDDFAGSHLVGPEEQAAAEWWKPDAQDQPKVHIAHVGHNLVRKNLR